MVTFKLAGGVVVGLDDTGYKLGNKFFLEEVAWVDALHKTELYNVKFISGPRMRHMLGFHFLR